MRLRWVQIPVTVVTLLTSFQAKAGGFYVPEIGARAVGVSGAMTAQSADASALFHNPAAMAGQKGTQLQLGGALAFPKISFFRRPTTDPNTGAEINFDGVTNTNSVGAIPYLAGITDLVGDDLSVGLGIFAPFGVALHYPDDGAQRNVVTSVDLRTLYISPAVAYRVTKELSVGLMLSYIYADFELTNRNALQFLTGDPEVFPNPDVAAEGDTRIDVSDTFTLGAKIGIYYRDTSDRLAFGFSLLLPATLRMRGAAAVQNNAITALQDDAGQVLQEAGQRQDEVGLDIPLPLIASLGVLYRPSAQATFSMDVTWQGWSRFESMVVDFENEHELLPTPGAFLYDLEIDNSWNDSISLRLGAEFSPICDVPLGFRLGVLYDQSPIDDRHFDVLSPDSDKLGLSAGVGYSFVLGENVGLDVDAAFLQLFLQERNIEPGGRTVSGTTTAVPGSDRTIQNKVAPSFFYGVTRARISLGYLGVTLRI